MGVQPITIVNFKVFIIKKQSPALSSYHPQPVSSLSPRPKPFIYFLFFSFFRATPAAYGRSQARGQMGVTAASLYHSHSNVGSQQHLWPTLQFAAAPDP